MKQYRIENRTSGVDLGAYEGETEQEALDAMARDAGYQNYEEAQATAPADDDDIVVTEMN